jgi:hypothetical protein
VQIEIASPGLAGIQLYAPLMNGGQYFFEESGNPLGYAPTAHYKNNLLEFETVFCEPPLSPEVDHVGTSSATLSWSANGDGPAWIVSWGETGFNPDISGNITNGVHTNTYTITGLQLLTDYDAYVRTACTELNLSTWVGPVSFTTAGNSSNVWLENIIISFGEDFCYESTDTIFVAGNGSHFIVENSGAAQIVAGKTVYLLSGVKVHENAYLRVWISDDGIFCTKQESLLAASKDVFQVDEIREQLNKDAIFRIYPNPGSGIFNLEIIGEPQEAFLEIYGLMGVKYLEKRLAGQNKYVLDLSDKHAGVYLLRIVINGESGMLKLIKN